MRSLSVRIPVYGTGGVEAAYALVDAEDFEKVSAYRWRLHTNGYAVAGKRNVYMHRFLLDAPKELEVDHLNHNRLDNRRANLKLVTSMENSQNQPTSRPTATGVRGVYWCASKQRFRVQVSVRGRKVCQTTHKTLEEAAEAARQARLKYMAHSIDDLKGGCHAA